MEASEILLTEYQKNMKGIIDKVNAKLSKKKTLIIKTAGHSMVGEQTVHVYDYVGQIYELTEYLKRMEYEVEHLFNFFTLVADDETRKEGAKLRDEYVSYITNESKKLVNLKRALTTLERSC